MKARSIASLTGNTGAYSIVGINSIKMANDSFTDSYRSSAGPWTLATRSYNGAIASNGAITLIDSADVYGDARCGPERLDEIVAHYKASGTWLQLQELLLLDMQAHRCNSG